MATLSGQTIANTFDSLLHVEDDTAGLVATSTDSRVIQDGVGAASALALATDSVRITSTNKLYFNDVDGEYISGDGTDLTITSGRHIVLALGSAGSVYHTGDGGSNNAIYGLNAGIALASGGNQNVLLGEGAGAALTIGDNNVVMGYLAFDAAADDESDNIAIGSGSMGACDQGSHADADIDNNVAIGTSALLGGDFGSSDKNIDNNVVIGHNAADATGTISCQKNVFIGADAASGTWATATSQQNVAIGYRAMDGPMNAANNNVAVGMDALGAITTGTQNVCVGFSAGIAIENAGSCTIVGSNAGKTIGGAAGNTFIGKSAGEGVQGQYNTVLGAEALIAATNDCDNIVAIGYGALAALDGSGGDATVAIGYQAGTAISSGANNLCIGSLSGRAITTGGQNIFVGEDTGRDLVTGVNNIAIGVSAFDAAGAVESYNIAIGGNAMGSVDEGGSGGDADLNIAIGYQALLGGDFSTNDRQLHGNIAIGAYALDATGANAQSGTMAIGQESLTALTSGVGNTAVGFETGRLTTTGTNNTYVGYQAGDATHIDASSNTIVGSGSFGGSHTGTVCHYNVAVGANTLLGAMNGVDGTVAVGTSALQALTTGVGNTAIGYKAGLEHETGARNTVLGYEAMFDTGANSGPASNDNIFIGYRAGGGTWSSSASERNVGIGNYAMDGAMNGSTDNTCIGHEAGTGMAAAAIGNTCIGANAGDGVTTGDNNVLLGKQAGTSSSPVTVSTGDNQLVVGNDNITNSYVKVDWTVGSDIRDKTDIETLPDVAGLNFVNQMRPVTYRWDNRSDYYEFGHKKFGERDHSKKSEQNEVGFIAQEVKEIEKSIGWEDDHIVNTRDENKYKLMYSQVTPILVKAIQELSQQVEDLKAKIE